MRSFQESKDAMLHHLDGAGELGWIFSRLSAYEKEVAHALISEGLAVIANSRLVLTEEGKEHLK
ncbi:hypothetical protein CC53_gp121 [Rhizobium phage vB_RleS_L338C]|uniref:hypothetical protein n=1 Tax=Rhizobium phage vB_RleS_L338C TaxID=1414737 RepID=UPI0003D8731C|nr:hypothetical protein CC53_gp121 [Rhizobium phage vB_RleS_L338C]AHC30538.1 hypothetical protein L338C_121 [Rhizobium phage vB_RleS_L338C]QNH72186.1 hypothetical protein P11VFA_029 [Rhizobium phage P11VFA]